MLNHQQIPALVNRIPSDTWEILREIKERPPAMMLSELIDCRRRALQRRSLWSCYHQSQTHLNPKQSLLRGALLSGQGRFRYFHIAMAARAPFASARTTAVSECEGVGSN